MKTMSETSSSPNRRGGFSLVELMIALAAGLVVSLALVAFLMSSFRSNGEYVVSTRLTQELRNSLDLITRDLRRAGYDEGALGHLAADTGSPFTRVLLGDQISAGPPATYSCVIYAYDKKAGPNPGVIDVANGEVRGLRWYQTTVNNRSVGMVEYAASTGAIRPTCAGAHPDYTAFPVACNTTSTWCPLTDPNALDITGLTFTDQQTTVGTAPNQVRLRDIEVALVGRPAGTTDYSRGVKSSVRVRSDCYAPTASLGNCQISP